MSIFTSRFLTILALVAAGFYGCKNAGTLPINDKAPRLVTGYFSDATDCEPLQHPYMTEVSGMVASMTTEGNYWMHNDSGWGPRLFMTDRNGKASGWYWLAGAPAADWEEMGRGYLPGTDSTFLWIADIGDNKAVRSDLHMIALAEPAAPTADSVLLNNFTSYPVAYEDGPRDAEAFLHDPTSGELLIISKRDKLSRLYRLPQPLSTKSTNVAEFLGELPFNQTTAATISADGQQVLIKNYSSIFYWQRKGEESLAQWLLNTKPYRLKYTNEPQGEAITFDSKGKNYLTTSELRLNIKPRLCEYKRDTSYR